ncbi:MAG: hypothetical protein Q8807_03290 ['Waltheria sp.' little leaf phytoplasma]|nr:hypothetical protein ['Waltheria sp.' little leaf phytoplasma]
MQGGFTNQNMGFIEDGEGIRVVRRVSPTATEIRSSESIERRAERENGGRENKGEENPIEGERRAEN